MGLAPVVMEALLLMAKAYGEASAAVRENSRVGVGEPEAPDRLGRPDARCRPGLAEALACLDEEGNQDGAPIIVTGSLFLVGDALALLGPA